MSCHNWVTLNEYHHSRDHDPVNASARCRPLKKRLALERGGACGVWCGALGGLAWDEKT